MEIEGDFAAIKALGSLFKLNEVYIWEEGWTETREVSLFPVSGKLSRESDDIIIRSKIPASISEFIEKPENEELTKEMDALGLPISFQSNKETKYKMNKSKRKNNRLKQYHKHKEAEEEALEFTKVSGVETVSPTVFNDNRSNSLSFTSMTGQSELGFYDVAVGIRETECLTGDSVSSNKIICGAVMEQILEGTSDNLSNPGQECESAPNSNFMFKDDSKVGKSLSSSDRSPQAMCYLTGAGAEPGEKESGGRSPSDNHDKRDNFSNDDRSEHVEISEPTEFSVSSEVVGHGEVDSHNYYGEFGDWRVYWDSFYMRYYFHNVKTETSTWCPPPGMEHLASTDSPNESDEATTKSTEKDGGASIDRDSLNYSEISGWFGIEKRLINQPSDDVLFGIGVMSGRSMPCVSIPPLNGNFEHSDELLGTSGGCDDEFALHLPSDMLEHMDSFMSTVTEELSEDCYVYLETADPIIGNLDIQLDPAMKKQKKKARKTKVHRKSSLDSEEFQDAEMFEQFPSNISKYWCQRYTLFSRFDDGIRMDVEGWFSVTPEPIAKHHALRCNGDVIIDCFTGVGGNAIQFAQRYKHVIAIDIDPKKIDYAYHNASIYGVNDQIDFILGDFFALASKLKADTVFLSPPWGGPAYSKVKTYDVKTMLKPHDGYFLFNTAKQISGRIVMFLPRNIDLNQLAELSLSSNPPWSLEVEKNFMNGKLKAITAYFSNTTVMEGQ